MHWQLDICILNSSYPWYSISWWMFPLWFFCLLKTFKLVRLCVSSHNQWIQLLHTGICISSVVSRGWWLVIYLIFQCTAIGSFKEQVESLQSLDTSVEILVRLLCAVPGWGEKNVQVSIYWQCLAFWVFGPIWPMTYVIPTAGSATSNRCHHSYSFNCI